MAKRLRAVCTCRKANALAVVALVTNSEIIAMHLIASSPPVDVPWIFALPKQSP